MKEFTSYSMDMREQLKDLRRVIDFNFRKFILVPIKKI
jgi:hypothetical protein